MRGAVDLEVGTGKGEARGPMKAMLALDSITGVMGHHGRGQQMGNRQIEFRSRRNHLVVVGGRIAGTQSPPYAPELAAQLQVLVSSFESPGKHIQTGFCGHCGSHTCFSPQLLTHPQGSATFGEVLLLLTTSTEVHNPTLLDCAPRRAFLPTRTLPCPLVHVSVCPQAPMLMRTCLRETGNKREEEEEALEGTCRRRELKDLAASWPCRFPSGEPSPCRLFYLCLFVCLPVLLHLLMCLSLSSHMLLGWSQRFRDKLSLPPSQEARHAHARTQQKQLLGLTALHSLHSSSPRTCLIISLPVPKGV